jgi:drug/metabolite transporter (DMT)-like permease
MKFSEATKGFLLALISVIAVSNVYIFSKAALMEVEIAQFGVYWFGFGLLWILIFAWFKKTYSKIKDIKLRSYLILVVLGINQVLGTYFFFKALYTISNPSIVSFITNLSPVLVVFLSFLILKERFNKIELAGMLLALFGAFIISYKGNTNLNTMFINGTQFILYSSVFGATNAVIVKKNVAIINPIILTISRSFFLLIFSFFFIEILKSTFRNTSGCIKKYFYWFNLRSVFNCNNRIYFLKIYSAFS